MAASTTMSPGTQSDRIGLTGWGIFAAATLIVLGAVNVINGFTAIQHSSYYRSDIVYHNFYSTHAQGEMGKAGAEAWRKAVAKYVG